MPSDKALASLVRKSVARVQVNGEVNLWFEQALGTNFTDSPNLLAASLPPGAEK